MKITYSIANNQFLLLPEKAMLWESKKMLLIADLHLGKVNHFRRAGIAAPQNPNKDNLERLISLVSTHKPDRVVFMGDLFHSHYNEEWEAFGQTLKYFPAISFELVMGNHDIMSEYQYLKHALLIHKQPLKEEKIILSHEPLEEMQADEYNLAGHIHPGVKLRGKGRQQLKLPCFIFGKKKGLLPAFGAFTGLARQRPAQGDKVFVVVENQVMEIENI